ncbi:alpha-1,2-fucosyltransferase [Acidovorax sp. SUPP2522]|uniref:hypothetical protein n=1 Tax=unclassified Acidovorax TaxID=2684926 RepID=UPI00234A94C7|nr:MULTISPECIES: hypothetical protein [unclassified Acidovorax]WCM99007.1 hypothetical protein M5C96_06125 [Acidovorax sp. GBBC 1281]GKT13739.1 alpha-1,2-fucosyltransferase [Acidovorax sp. SUPP2522]
MTTTRVFLRGGLGNQFFEWLHALTLAESGADVALDTSFLRKVPGNQAIGALELAKVFTDLRLPTRRTEGLWRAERVLVRAARLLGQLHTDATPAHGDWHARYHYGYYQHSRHHSESALRQARELLRPAFRAAPPGLSRYAALHVRGGDYAASRYNREQIGPLGEGYYRGVLQVLERNWPELQWLVISDDYAHARAMLSPLAAPDRCLFLDTHLGGKETADQALQALINADVLACANSSFSALAGYVGRAHTVFAPTPWFRGLALTSTDPSLPLWHRLDADFAMEP